MFLEAVTAGQTQFLVILDCPKPRMGWSNFRLVKAIPSHLIPLLSLFLSFLHLFVLLFFCKIKIRVGHSSSVTPLEATTRHHCPSTCQLRGGGLLQCLKRKSGTVSQCPKDTQHTNLILTTQVWSPAYSQALKDGE